jgi:class 3 adenylate cyclase/tetratricopeptide (TPR) repeat protein
MQCAECGTPAGEDQRFCGACGRALQVACAACGYENPPDHRFCGGCGASLTGPTPAPKAPTVTTVERRVVSVLFVDLVGFTSFSEGRDPEDVRDMITDYFDLARDVVDRFGGTVDKYIGDAVMAWWGATTTNEDDAERAVRASLELVERVVTMGERTGIPGLTARVGVMTGEVSVGPGGNERGLLLGDLVNTASRLQGLAEPGTVLVGETTADLVATAIELVPAGTHRLKGREEPVRASRAVQVLGERGGRGRSDILEPPFVGRAGELRLLKDGLHAVGHDGRARLVSVVGQAGIGKSRLVWEFQKYIDGLVETVYWHEGRSPAYGDGLALWALGEMVRRRCGIQEGDDEDTTKERLATAVAEHVVESEHSWVESRLAALLGIGGSVGSERTELFAAVRLFFEGIAAKGTVVLVFEDLHWADPSLLEFVDELPDWSQNHPILIVTLSRPDLLDGRPDWGSGRRGFSSTYLSPLADDEMRQLISGAVPGVPSSAVDKIVAAAGGVPLFAVEMVRMLLADGRLIVGSAGVEVAGDLDELEVPSSVHAVVGARLDRLAPDDRDLARDAAVLGHSFTVESLTALREEAVDKVERRLADLVRREIFELVRDPRSPERGQYRWVQSVVREVAYGRIARPDRHDLHVRAARYLRGLDEPELAPLVAAHFVAASEATPERKRDLEGELARSLQAAIDRAEVLHAHEQVLSLVDSALGLVAPEIEIELRELAAMAAVRISDSSTADRHVAAVQVLAAGSDDLSAAHRAAALAGRVGNDTRRPHLARDALEPHLAEHPDFIGDPNLARAAVYLARTRLLLGDLSGAAELADRALGAVERFDLIEEVADALVTRGTGLSVSRPRQAMALLWGALDIARSHGLSDVMLRCLINIGYAANDHQIAVKVNEEAFEEAKRIGDRSHASYVVSNLAGSYSLGMNYDGMERVLMDPVLSNDPSDRVNALVARSEVLLARGDRIGADELFAEAKELTRDVSDPQSLLAVERRQASMDLIDCRGRDVFEVGRRQFSSDFAPGLAASIALEGATIEGDLGLLEQAAGMVADLPAGPLTETLASWVAAMIQLVEGDLEGAVREIDDLIEQTWERGLHWVSFEVMVMAARHLPPDHPTRAAYVARAREVAEDAGALGLVDWVERMVG